MRIPEKSIRLGVVAALSTAALSAQSVAATPKSDANLAAYAGYFGNTVICLNNANSHRCTLWLNPDGRYALFYNVGEQPTQVAPNGPFQYEGSEGAYSVRVNDGSSQVCLHPQKRGPSQAEQAHELFAEAACYDLAAHRSGDRWSQKDREGHDYTVWLIQGR